MNFQTSKVHFQEVDVVAASSCRRRKVNLLESICHCFAGLFSGANAYLFYEASGEMPTCRGFTEYVSTFLISSDSQCFVDLSSNKQAVNVPSRRWSGKHCCNASQALQNWNNNNSKTYETQLIVFYGKFRNSEALLINWFECFLKIW